MGNDVETLVDRLRPLLIEWWAGSLTVGVAMWMLASQLGAVCVVPIIAALGMSYDLTIYPTELTSLRLVGHV
jgi:hypothetical protein